jgi:hypothetical protein
MCGHGVFSQIIGMVVTRQWRLFGNEIEELLPQTHANMMSLQSLIGTIKVATCLPALTFLANNPVLTESFGKSQPQMTACLSGWHYLQRETDGPKRCGLYCRILKVMCEAKLEDLQVQVRARYHPFFSAWVVPQLWTLTVSWACLAITRAVSLAMP